MVRPRSSLLTDFVGTSAAQTTSLLLNAASLAVISRRLGELDLGLYTLERRSMAFIQPIILLGLSVATPRYIALARGRGSIAEAEYARAGSALVIVSALVVAGALLLFPGPAASVAFGDRHEVGLARALGGFAFVTAVFQIVYSIFRGRQQVRRANLLELVVVGVLPFGLALWGPQDVARLVWSLSLGIMCATAVALLWQRDRLRFRGTLSAVRRRAMPMLKFGAARTPGDFAVVALFALGPIAVVQFGSATEAGYTSVVQSSLNLVGVVAVPLGVLLLPRVALDLARRDPQMRRRYSLLAGATVDVAVGAAAVVFIASPLIVRMWLPSQPDVAVTAQRVLAFGVPGYVFYLVFRSYLDAIHTRPLSSVATLVGLAGFVTLLPITLASSSFSAPVAACLALAVGLTLKGVVTYWLVRAHLDPFIGVSAVAGIVVAVVIALAIARLPEERAAPAVVIGTLAFCAVYAALLLQQKREWVRELARRFGRLGGQSPLPR